MFFRSAILGFVRGWEDIGLLLMRLACGGVLMGEAVSRISGIPASDSLVYIALMMPASLAVLIGYWTRIAGAGTTALEVSLLTLGESYTPRRSMPTTCATVLTRNRWRPRVLHWR
jgi:hypothetical protein